ncbi:aldo/keto reductase [Sodalis ligni]|uniref:Aryl-alcohol dehydrogenase-like predicted oxidoreductase n=1 Tax=Sodalis ligni TaxID=2697027 RepID=A0A4R1NG05_9GAMM|nr:aldo/keto reductase [Sodalis ligni]TCL05927.1 aryl-alcohol dehydrogenase-like predicted oxidoreductase [Sodalis ligni]
MSLDAYLTLGRSGLRISPLCLGTMTFGEDWGWGSSVSESETILATFLDRGGNFIDTANMYTKGHSEKIIGDFFARDGGRRDRVVLATKFSGNMYRGDPNGGGCSAKTIIASCEQSLRRLQTDYIDLYWQHAWDAFTPIEETMRAMDSLVGSGKVRYIGFSDTPAWKVAQAQTLAQFRGWSPLIALQIEYSLLQRTVEDELIPMALELGLGVVPWSPLAGGILSGKYRRDNRSVAQGGRSDSKADSLGDREYAIIDALIAIAAAHGATPAAVALAWVQSRPGVASSIIGVRRLDQLEANLSALEVRLSDEEIAELSRLSAPPETFINWINGVGPTVFQGGTTVNGRPAEVFPLSPENDDQRY